MSANAIALRTYLIVYVVLLVLLALTVLIAKIDLERIALLAALIVAGVKAALVLIYFMHLRYARGITRLFALAGLLWIALLIGLTMSDVLNRTVPLTASKSADRSNREIYLQQGDSAMSVMSAALKLESANDLKESLSQ